MRACRGAHVGIVELHVVGEVAPDRQRQRSDAQPLQRPATAVQHLEDDRGGAGLGGAALGGRVCRHHRPHLPQFAHAIASR